jgi:hypothetical protein
MWHGGGHLHKDYPEKENNTSTPTCCNCKLADGAKPHLSNYRGCSHAREEIRRRRFQKVEKKTTGRIFSPSYMAPDLSFAAALSKQPDKS